MAFNFPDRPLRTFAGEFGAWLVKRLQPPVVPVDNNVNLALYQDPATFGVFLRHLRGYAKLGDAYFNRVNVDQMSQRLLVVLFDKESEGYFSTVRILDRQKLWTAWYTRTYRVPEPADQVAAETEYKERIATGKRERSMEQILNSIRFRRANGGYRQLLNRVRGRNVDAAWAPIVDAFLSVYEPYQRTLSNPNDFDSTIYISKPNANVTNKASIGKQLKIIRDQTSRHRSEMIFLMSLLKTLVGPNQLSNAQRIRTVVNQITTQMRNVLEEAPNALPNNPAAIGAAVDAAPGYDNGAGIPPLPPLRQNQNNALEPALLPNNLPDDLVEDPLADFEF